MENSTISTDLTPDEIRELKIVLGQLYRLARAEIPNLQWQREHDKNHELYLRLQKYV
jgi:hypothetical protein